jgi:hypothetical protein
MRRERLWLGRGRSDEETRRDLIIGAAGDPEMRQFGRGRTVDLIVGMSGPVADPAIGRDGSDLRGAIVTTCIPNLGRMGSIVALCQA